MLSNERCQDLFESILRESDADETEVMIGDGTHALTRFANNVIHQNVSEESRYLSVRLVYEGRTARASTNKLDEESLRRVVRDCRQAARASQVIPALLPMPGRQTYPAVNRFSEATAAAGPEDRARLAGSAVSIAERSSLTAAGVVATGQSLLGIMNSRGLAAFYRDTHSEFSVTMTAPNSSGWAKSNSPDLSALAVEERAESAAHKAAASRDPIELAPGRYPVILEPAAVLDLFGFCAYDFSGLALLEQRSFLNERMGTSLFGGNITVWDDVAHPLQTGAPFDGEGLPRQRVCLVEKGVVREVVYARQTAHRAGKQSTGHGFPLPNEMGEAPMNIVIEGGASSVEAMIASTERGILVTRLWYIREVEPYQKVLTGMTRDGTFLVENGHVTRGILNMRFNQSMVELLSKVDMLGPTVRSAGEEAFEMAVPAMKVKDFHFTEVTRF